MIRDSANQPSAIPVVFFHSILAESYLSTIILTLPIYLRLSLTISVIFILVKSMAICHIYGYRITMTLFDDNVTEPLNLR